MANPTAAVQSFVVPSTQEIIEWPMASTVQDYYPNEMIGENSGGFGTKFDDAAALKFLGLVEDSVRISVLTGDANGDRRAKVIKPKYFSMKLTSVADTDRGKPVYAKFSNEVQFAVGAFANLVGFVVKKQATDIALIAPLFEGDQDYLNQGSVMASFNWTATTADTCFFVATRPYMVKAITAAIEVAGTDAGAVTAQVRKAPSATDIAAGTVLHTGTINLKGTVDTNQVLTLSATQADLMIATGDRIGFDITGVMTAAIGAVTVALTPL